MNNVNKVLIRRFIGLALTAGASSAIAKGGKPTFLRADTVPETIDTEAESEVNDEVAEITDADLLDYNEKIHLFFMREEEKLTRDVYTKPGFMYPDSVIFGNIDDSEQRHATAVKKHDRAIRL